MINKYLVWIGVIVGIFFAFSCSKGGSDSPAPTPAFDYLQSTVDGVKVNNGSTANISSLNPVIVFSFSAAVKESVLTTACSLKENGTTVTACRITTIDDKKTITIEPSAKLKPYSKYTLSLSGLAMQSEAGKKLGYDININLVTGVDTSDKFIRISDDELLDLVQKQTLKYFWDYGHPDCGMAKERSGTNMGNVVTTGGTGFGIMAMIVGAERGFIPRADVLTRVQKITTFLKTKCTPYHGAFAHWINGATGVTERFGEKDDGADLVETSFLMQGLLTARQYFKGASTAEVQLRTDINSLWEAVDWDWFRKNGSNTLYWHWSPNYNWDKNLPIGGWDEALITYVLAASSPAHSIPKTVYDNGWAHNGTIRNGKTFYGVTLPLGDDLGGPMFFSHYSFLGLDPNALSDAYCSNYKNQVVAHAQINNKYCIANPKGYNGYSADCWGLTASDGDKEYNAHSPSNDRGVIAPTAALASMPYTPTESMRALKYFYYKMGDKVWKNYGFVDAFNLSALWFDDQFLAIDQGPIVVMIENHRSQLLWNLFMSAPEVKTGLTKLGFTSPKI